MRIDEVESLRAAAHRLRRKVEILRMDFKARGMPAKHDMDEMLTLVEIITKGLDKELQQRNKD